MDARSPSSQKSRLKMSVQSLQASLHREVEVDADEPFSRMFFMNCFSPRHVQCTNYIYIIILISIANTVVLACRVAQFI